MTLVRSTAADDLRGAVDKPPLRVGGWMTKLLAHAWRRTSGNLAWRRHGGLECYRGLPPF